MNDNLFNSVLLNQEEESSPRKYLSGTHYPAVSYDSLLVEREKDEPGSRTGYSPICAKNARAETRASRWSVMIAPPTFMTELPDQYCHFAGII